MKRAAMLFLLLATIPALAQTKASVATEQPPILGETIDVSILNLDVFVTDKEGRRVHGLKPEDFEIREDGKEQPISNFAEYAPAMSAGETTDENGVVQRAAHPAPAQRRNIVLFVELYPTPVVKLKRVYDGLRNLVRDAVRPGDRVSVIAYNTRSLVRVEQSDDQAVLIAAIDLLEKQNIGLGVRAEDRQVEAAVSDAMMTQSLSTATVEARGLASLEEMEKADLGLMELVAYRRRSRAIVAAIEGMAGAEGKKILILVMNRFGIALRPSLVHKPDTIVLRLREAVMRAANADGVTIYPIYPQTPEETNPSIPVGLRPNIFDVSPVDATSSYLALVNQMSSFVEIAQQTGGLSSWGPDTFDMLPHVVEDLDSYYSLAYRVTSEDAGRQRRIVVKTKNGEYTVRSRRAVVDRTEDEEMGDRVVANLFQDVGPSKIPVSVTLGQLARKNKKITEVPVTVHIPANALTSLQVDGAVRGAFSVFVSSGGAYGLMSPPARRAQPFTFPPQQFEKLRGKDFTYTATIEIDGRVDTISVGVRDDVSKDFGLARVAIPGRVADRQGAY